VCDNEHLTRRQKDQEWFAYCQQGFSLDSGFALLSKSELTIVSGAPRGGYSGQVAFLKADPKAQRNLSVELVISGPGLASSFGYDVAVVDLDGDG
uniref:Integrin alpha-2 domain-containing protein n=1 Tax=Acanthochromis polyacanthus TaxID=80966 RepID=A0A3Q1FLK8_9TELE